MFDSDSSPATRVAVVIVNWNGKEHILACLESLRAVTYRNLQIIVVDNASEDGSQEAIRHGFPHVQLIQNHENVGYGAAANLGIRAAYETDTSYFLVLNNDLILAANCIEEMLASFENDSSVGLVCPKIYWMDDPLRIYSIGARVNLPLVLGLSFHLGENEIDRGQYNASHYVDVAGIFMVSRKVIETVGGFSTDFFLYFEDYDWCIRSRKAGYKMRLSPSARMWHRGSAGVGGHGSPRVVYFLTRNRFLLWKRHLNGISYGLTALATFLVSLPIRTLFFVLRGSFAHLRAFFRGMAEGPRFAERHAHRRSWLIVSGSASLPP